MQKILTKLRVAQTCPPEQQNPKSGRGETDGKVKRQTRDKRNQRDKIGTLGLGWIEVQGAFLLDKIIEREKGRVKPFAS